MAPAAKLKITPTRLPGVLLLEPLVFADDRGFFLESYNRQTMEAAGITHEFVQDNHSFSVSNVLRGLHYQLRHVQAKLIRVVQGVILDVAVDLRRSSPSFGRWISAELSGENRHMLYIPAGFAHGFRVQSQTAHVLYKSSDFYDPGSERTLIWNDPDVAIDWRLMQEPILSSKDQHGLPLASAELFP